MLSLNGPTLQLSTPSEPVNDKTAHSYSMAVPVIHYTTHNTTASASLSASRALNLTHVILLCKVCHRQRRRHLHSRLLISDPEYLLHRLLALRLDKLPSEEPSGEPEPVGRGRAATVYVSVIAANEVTTCFRLSPRPSLPIPIRAGAQRRSAKLSAPSPLRHQPEEQQYRHFAHLLRPFDCDCFLIHAMPLFPAIENSRAGLSRSSSQSRRQRQ